MPAFSPPPHGTPPQTLRAPLPEGGFALGAARRPQAPSPAIPRPPACRRLCATRATAAGLPRLREPSPEEAAAPPPDLDGIWKHALQTWLPDCLALFWPKIHQRIDAAFAERMFRYRIRLYEKYPHHTILSCAILLDREHGATLETFRSAGLGDELIFRFPVVNLARWRRRQPILERRAATNPFAVIVMAQLRYRATRSDATRMGSKLQLARSLAEWGYDGDTRRALLDLIDSLLVLPEPLEEVFTEILEQTGEATVMQQLNSVQRVMLRREKAASLEEGLREGKMEGAAALLQSQLQHRFGPLPAWAAARIASAAPETLQQWALLVLEAERIEDVFGG